MSWSTSLRTLVACDMTVIMFKSSVSHFFISLHPIKIHLWFQDHVFCTMLVSFDLKELTCQLGQTMLLLHSNWISSTSKFANQNCTNIAACCHFSFSPKWVQLTESQAKKTCMMKQSLHFRHARHWHLCFGSKKKQITFFEHCWTAFNFTEINQQPASCTPNG